MTTLSLGSVSIPSGANLPTVAQKAGLAAATSPGSTNPFLTKSMVPEVVVPSGADASGIADSTAAFQAMLNALGTRANLWSSTRKCAAYIGPGTYKLASGLVGTDLLGVQIVAAGRKWGTKLNYTGAPGSIAIDLYDCREVDLQGFYLSGDGVAADALIRIKEDGTVDTGDDAIPNARFNRIIDVSLLGGDDVGIGIDVDGEDQNNDFHLFNDVHAVQFTVAGIRLNKSQAKACLLYNCILEQSAVGLLCAINGPNFQMRGGIVYDNDIDFHINGVNDACLIEGVTQELSRRFLVIDSYTPDNGTSVVIMACRISNSGMHADKKYIRLKNAGALIMIGNAIGEPNLSAAQGAQISVEKGGVSEPTIIELRGNQFIATGSVDTEPIVEDIESPSIVVNASGNWFRTSGNIVTAKPGYTMPAMSNRGASGVTSVQLPKGFKGLVQTFTVEAAFQYKILCPTGQTIQMGSSVATATTGFIYASSLGDTITLYGTGTGWVCGPPVGGWSVG